MENNNIKDPFLLNYQKKKKVITNSECHFLSTFHNFIALRQITSTKKHKSRESQTERSLAGQRLHQMSRIKHYIKFKWL